MQQQQQAPINVNVGVNQQGGATAQAAPGGGGAGPAPQINVTAKVPTPIYTPASKQNPNNVIDIREAIARKMEQENSSRGQYSPQDIAGMGGHDDADAA
jgi:hypothetical protein